MCTHSWYNIRPGGCCCLGLSVFHRWSGHSPQSRHTSRYSGKNARLLCRAFTSASCIVGYTFNTPAALCGGNALKCPEPTEYLGIYRLRDQRPVMAHHCVVIIFFKRPAHYVVRRRSGFCPSQAGLKTNVQMPRNCCIPFGHSCLPWHKADRHLQAILNPFRV